MFIYIYNICEKPYIRIYTQKKLPKCTEEATEMAAKYLHNKKNVFIITLKNIAHYYYNGFEVNIYIIYINIW